MPLYKKLRSDSEKHYSKRAVKKLLKLRAGRITENIPDRTLKKTLLLATWNIRDFDSNKFKQGPRLDESYYYIAEIISCFDIVALQELNVSMRPIKRVLSILGPNWDFITTDVNAGTGGNQERLGFVFDKRKVFFRNIAGEIIISKSNLSAGVEEEIKMPMGNEIVVKEDFTFVNSDGDNVTIKKGDTFTLPKNQKILLPEGQKLIRRQHARTPFMVSFQSGWFKFNLCTAHILFGSGSKGKKRRVKEIESLSKHLAKKSKEHFKVHNTTEHFIMLGDFNVVSETDATFKAMKKHKFEMPQGIYLTNAARSMAYDQIAFAPIEGKMRYTGNSGVFDIFNYVFEDEDRKTYNKWMNTKSWKKSRNKPSVKYPDMPTEDKEHYYKSVWRTFQMSDHLPLWVELEIDFSDEYLLNAKEELERNTFVNPTVD